MSSYREIYCCECKKIVNARFTDWEEVYPHLREMPYHNFYICDKCKNFVGVHKGTNIPLGTIPTKEIKEYRKKIHSIIDQIFLKSKNKRLTRKILFCQHMGRKQETMDNKRRLWYRDAENFLCKSSY